MEITDPIPCLCGEDAELVHMDNILEGYDLDCYYVYCEHCNSVGQTAISAEDAIWYWLYS